MAWRTFTDAPSTVFRSPGRLSAFRAAIVADLRMASRRYLTDSELRSLVRDLHEGSGNCASLWDAEDQRQNQADELTVDDPDLGRFMLDKDVLMVEPGDLRVVVLSAPVNSPDANRLAAMTG